MIVNIETNSSNSNNNSNNSNTSKPQSQQSHAHQLQKQSLKINALYMISNIFITHGGSKEEGLEYFRKEIQKHDDANKE